MRKSSSSSSAAAGLGDGIIQLRRLRSDAVVDCGAGVARAALGDRLPRTARELDPTKARITSWPKRVENQSL